MAATNGWDQFLTHISGFYSAKKDEWTKQNVCEMCAIYGLDGTLWAASPKWKALSEYDFTVEGLGDESKQVKVNEFKIADEVSKGQRNPSDAGVRLCGQKFMFKNHMEGVTMLSKGGGGGGSVGRTNKAIVIAIFEKDTMMTNKQVQNPGDVTICLERVCKFMNAAGF